MKNSLSKSLLVVLGLAGALAACAPQKQNVGVQADTSIIGGVIVEGSDVIAKTTVALVASVVDSEGKESQYICTGSLVKDNVVLTAGHCVPEAKEGEKVALYVVFTKDLNNIQRGQVRLVDKVAVHPSYGTQNDDGSDANDIALVRFAGTKAIGYQIAQFLSDDSLLADGAMVTLAGYGLTDGVNKTSDNKLRKVDDIEIIQSFGKTEIALDQSKGKGACHGDSGGPAFLTVKGVPYVWGITSRGIGKNGADDCSLFSLYTKVNAQKTFVDQALVELAK